jgi:hypothetical protein
MQVSEIFNTSVTLTQAPASQANFSVPMLLVDHADVPVDLRRRIVTRSDYTTILTAASAARNWCTGLWSQNYNANQAYIGRWISAATASHWVFDEATSVASVYAALTNTGQFALTEAGGATQQVNPDFTGDTTMADVCASIQAGILAAGGDTSAYTCALDALNRPVITSDNTGSSAAAVAVATPAAGTDLTGALYLGTGFAEAGYDIEALGDAAAAIFALDNTPFAICEDGGNTAQQVAFSTAMNALNKLCMLNINDANAKNAADTTDAAYLIDALGHNQAYLVYTEHVVANGAAADQYVDAAFCGEILARPKEGTTNFAGTPLTGLSESGLAGDKTTVIPLTATERSALEGKGCDYLVNPAGLVHAVDGLTPGGKEVRLVIAAMWFEAKVSEDGYAYWIAQDVVTYSVRDMMAIKGIISGYAEELQTRLVIDRTNESWNFPDISTFSSAVQATHVMTLSDVYSCPTQNSVNSFILSMSLVV